MKKKIYRTDFFLFLSNQNSFVEHKNLDESMEDNEKMNNHDELFSRAIRAGKRTYFFDVKTTKGDEKYITITESKRRFSNEQNRFFYEKHKLFLYKEDFEKFKKIVTELNVDNTKSIIELDLKNMQIVDEDSLVDVYGLNLDLMEVHIIKQNTNGDLYAIIKTNETIKVKNDMSKYFEKARTD